MKKFTAVILALVIALSCATIAFADNYQCPYCHLLFDEGVYNDHVKTCEDNPKNTTTKTDEEASLVCPYCEQTFENQDEYNRHIQICYSQMGNNDSDSYADFDKFINLDLNGILDKLISAFEIDTTWWDAVEDIIIRLVDLIENIGFAASGEAAVAGAVDELEAKVAELPIVGDVLTYIHNLITTLKQKIKDLYSGNKETEIEETVAETEEEYAVQTGNSSIGIAAFAAVSVAAAAAFVCMKKKDN